MRVLALTNLYPDPYDPLRAAFNRQQFKALAADHDVQIIAPIAWTREWVRRSATDPRWPEGRRRIGDGMVVHHPRFTFPPKLLRGWYGRFLVQSVRPCFQEVVYRFRPEVVLGCWAYPDGWAAVNLAREAGLPVAIKVHGSDLLTIGGRRRWGDGVAGRQGRTRQAMERADAIVAVSRHLAQRACALGADPARVHVVYNGIDTDLFHPHPHAAARAHIELTLGQGAEDRGSSADPFILFVGNLVRVKGLDVLIDALAALARQGLRFRCGLIGDGPLGGPTGQLQAQIDANGLTGRVQLLGPRPQEQLPLWYSAADLLVLPSRSEGVPNVLLEAAACGTPFVASDVGGIPEIAHPDALVPAGDAAALAERIRSVLGVRRPLPDPKFRTGTWTDSARALADVLEGVVAGAAGQRSLAG
jgi:glycosyltransferase involved in cell wall biosynthesis